MPDSATLETILQRSRLGVTSAVCGLYLLYTLGTTLLTPDPLSVTLQEHAPRYWAALFVALTLLLLKLFSQRVRELYLPFVLLLLAVAVNEVLRLTDHTTTIFPYHLGVWLMVNTTVLFLVYGTRMGLWLLGGFMATLCAALLLNWPSTPDLAADWLTTLIVIFASGLASFALMRIIELNLLAHQRTSAELRVARLDTLTKLHGRAVLEEELRRALQVAEHSGKPVSVVLFDIDHFKLVNDQHSHSKGDQVLREFAELLSQETRPLGTFVGRWGGEEFLMILSGVGCLGAFDLAEGLREKVKTTPLAGLNITISGGVTCSQETPLASPENIFASADDALYEAKHAGRDMVRLAHAKPRCAQLSA